MTTMRNRLLAQPARDETSMGAATASVVRSALIFSEVFFYLSQAFVTTKPPNSPRNVKQPAAVPFSPKCPLSPPIQSECLAYSESRFIRNGVGVPSPDIALFVISEIAVTFHEFGTLFRDKLLCQEALFLDGAISSLHAPALKRSDSRMDLGPIIGVAE